MEKPSGGVVKKKFDGKKVAIRRGQMKKIMDLEELVESQEDINLLHKFKRQIMMCLLNKERVRIPGLGIAELQFSYKGNQHAQHLKDYKIVVEPDTPLKVKILNGVAE